MALYTKLHSEMGLESLKYFGFSPLGIISMNLAFSAPTTFPLTCESLTTSTKSNSCISKKERKKFTIQPSGPRLLSLAKPFKTSKISCKVTSLVTFLPSPLVKKLGWCYTISIWSIINRFPTSLKTRLWKCSTTTFIKSCYLEITQPSIPSKYQMDFTILLWLTYLWK